MVTCQEFPLHFPLITCLPFLLLVCSEGVVSLFGSAKSDGVVIPSQPKLIEGSNLTLNCIIMDYNTTPLRSSSLYFKSIYMNGKPVLVNSTFYNVLDLNTLQLFIPDIKREDGNLFRCYINDSDLTNTDDTMIGSASVDIGELPYPLTNVSIVSDNLDNMTVTWCPTETPIDPVSCALTWRIEHSTLFGNCTTMKNVLACSCTFCGYSASGVCVGKDQNFYPNQDYFINISCSNVYGSTFTSVEVTTSSAIVKPRPVSGLNVSEVGSRSVDIVWDYPQGLHPDRFVLTFQISGFSKWGDSFLVDAGNSTSWLLTDLKPYTNYTIAVRCKPQVDGYWSDNSSIMVTTLQDTPEVPPEIPVGFFRLFGCSKENDCNVTIFWKLIEEQQRNGVILGYRLSVESKYCSPCASVHVSGSDTTSAGITIPDGVDSLVRIVAYTSAGESPPGHIYFPSYFKSLPNMTNYGVYAEVKEDRRSVFIAWNRVENVDNYTLMYCLGTQANLTHCQSPPVEILLPTNQTNFTLNLTSPYPVFSPYPDFSPYPVFSLSANYKDGTNGLTSEWICVYNYPGLPAKPQLTRPEQLSETAVKVKWEHLLCIGNPVRVLQYHLLYSSNYSDVHGNITLPGNATEYVIQGLTPETDYQVALYAVSRSGPGPAAIDNIKTTVSQPVSVVVPVVVAVIVAAFIITAIFVIVYCVRRSRRWLYDINIKAPERHETVESQNDSSGSSDHYSTVTLSSEVSVEELPSSSVNLLNLSPASVFFESPLMYKQNGCQLEMTCEKDGENGGTSNKTNACESGQSIQTYTAAGFHPDASSETHIPKYREENNLSSDSPLSDEESNSVALRLELKAEQDSSEPCGYSQAHEQDSSGSLVDSSCSSDGYKVATICDFVPNGPPIAPQIEC